ncbi:sensor histidine kinase [Streptomyces sp. 796.1]|uniref:sensor histidine kinase n=1 Tax=Streptomyces sp. 796.1 TaxID=3163029 RepID=UPI0039C90A67
MLASLQRYADRHPRLVEGAFLALVYVITAKQYDRGGPGWTAGTVIAAGSCCTLLFRRTHPGAAVLGTGWVAAASGALGYELGPLLLLPVIVALYELAVRVPQRTAHLYGLGVTGLIVYAALRSEDAVLPWTDRVGPTVFWLLLPVIQGAAVQARRAYLEAVHTRAELAERTREEEARHRVGEERMRIARELHDVVAHHMALANAQAGTAAHLVRSRPEQAEQILGALSHTTASALRELQAAVGLLRQPDDPDDGVDPAEPAPGLGRLAELITAFAAAGLQVSVVVDGAERPLSPGVDLTAYRIVQEALTNVTKHAATGTAQVRLGYTHELLTLTVSDGGGRGSGRGSGGGDGGGGGGGSGGPALPGGGFGLINMRERARGAGGRLRAGRRPEGGFAVTAELPIHP